MHLERLLRTDIGRNIMSIVLGLGLASLFRRACNDRNCVVFRGPVIRDIEDRVFRRDDKCFVYRRNHVSCSPADPDKKEKTVIVDVAADNQEYADKRKTWEPSSSPTSNTASSPPAAEPASFSWTSPDFARF